MIRKNLLNRLKRRSTISVLAILILLISFIYYYLDQNSAIDVFSKNSDWEIYSIEATRDWKTYNGKTAGHQTPFTLLYPNDCTFNDVSQSVLSCPNINSEIDLNLQRNYGAVELISENSIILGMNAGWGKNIYKLADGNTMISYGLDNNDNGHSISASTPEFTKQTERKIEQIISTFDITGNLPEQKQIIDELRTEYAQDKYEIPEKAFVFLPWHKVIKGVIIYKQKGAARFIATNVSGMWKIVWIGQDRPDCNILSEAKIPLDSYGRYDSLICY